ncbi:MAG: putative toxin-antitoxin system toxin component, PIN family [Planctomycetes bacterium]|nr:putative toxin-antitoxin system toxin component, PIN family [Planctomycetota bacterium]
MTVRAVFDCMVFLQGAGRPTSPARACLRLVDEGDVTLCMSADILAEIRDVLPRPKTRKKSPSLTPESVAEFIKNVESKALVVANVPRVFTLERDPKDEPYLNLAMATAARVLVSRDKDLLDLMNEQEFRKNYPDLTILDPAAFLQAIADHEQSGPRADKSS